MAKSLANSYLVKRKQRHPIVSTKIKWTQSYTDTNGDLLEAETEIEKSLTEVLQTLESTNKNYPEEIIVYLNELFGETNAPTKALRFPRTIEECQRIEATCGESLVALQSRVYGLLDRAALSTLRMVAEDNKTKAWSADMQNLFEDGFLKVIYVY